MGARRCNPPRVGRLPPNPAEPPRVELPAVSKRMPAARRRGAEEAAR